MPLKARNIFALLTYPRGRTSKPLSRGPPVLYVSTSAMSRYALKVAVILQVDPNNQPWPAFRGYHTYSFANATMGHRLPTILGKAIDDVIVTLNEQSFEDRILDLMECIERMEELKRELERSAKLRPIIDDGEADVALWNKEIAKYFLGVMLFPTVSTTLLKAF